MAEYKSQYTGEQIDEAVGKALAADGSSGDSRLFEHQITITRDLGTTMGERSIHLSVFLPFSCTSFADFLSRFPSDNVRRTIPSSPTGAHVSLNFGVLTCVCAVRNSYFDYQIVYKSALIEDGKVINYFSSSETAASTNVTYTCNQIL